MTEEEGLTTIPQVVGTMTITFAGLELVLHYLLWDMLGGETKALRVVTGRLGFGALVDLMEALVKAGVPENKGRREKLRTLLAPLKKVGERRNSVAHALAVDFGDEHALTRVRDAVWDDHGDALRPKRMSVSEVDGVSRAAFDLEERVWAVLSEIEADAEA